MKIKINSEIDDRDYEIAWDAGYGLNKQSSLVINTQKIQTDNSRSMIKSPVLYSQPS